MVKCKKNFIGYIARASYYGGGFLPHIKPFWGRNGGVVMGWQKHPRQGQQTRRQLNAAEIARLTSEFLEKQVYLREHLVEVSPYAYYRDMFPEGSFEMENHIGERRPNGLASVLDDPEKQGRKYNRIIFDDLAMIDELMDRVEFVVVPPIGYSGRRRLSKFAYCFYGMCIDLDDVGVSEIRDLLYQMQNKLLPQASYIVNSGTGLHVVYLFEEPVPALPQYFESMGKLKERLSDMIWNQYTSRDKNKQYQGIFQGYRMVGSQTKISEACRVTAYKSGEKVTLHYLNQFVSEEDQCVFNDLSYTSREEAKEKWAEWYQRRIIERQPIGNYKLTEQEKVRRRAWYEAWKERIRQGAYDGNRHYCIGVLFNYGMKAEISQEEVLEDALGLVPYLNGLTEKENNEFTEDDVYSAMIYYDRKYIKMGRRGIQKMTKIDIGETKRNGRNRKDHVKLMNFVRDEINGNKNWRNKDGRPKGSGTKEELVRTYMTAHPEATVTEIARALNISRPTVYKWCGCEARKEANKSLNVDQGSLVLERQEKAVKRQNKDVYAEYRGISLEMDRLLRRIERMDARLRELNDATDERLRTERKMLHHSVWEAKNELNQMYRNKK